MANYTKQAASFTGLRGTVADPSIFDAEFNLVESTSRTKADKELPNTFLQAQTFNKSPTIPAGGTGNQPLTATEVTAKIAALETAINTLLAAKAPTASPTLTGAPRVPTATAGDSSTLIASTAFVANSSSGKPLGVGQAFGARKVLSLPPNLVQKTLPTNTTGRSICVLLQTPQGSPTAWYYINGVQVGMLPALTGIFLTIPAGAILSIGNVGVSWASFYYYLYE